MLAVAGAAAFVGAGIQGTVGFGLALVLAPVLALADPSLVPATVLLTTAALPVLSLWRERGAVDWAGLRWALLGRLPGTVLGAWVVTRLPPRALAIGVGVVVLAAVGLSLLTWSPSPTPGTLLGAGFISGVTGTATSIGGPPIALVYQRSPGPKIRGTLAVFFAVGAVVSLLALGVTGAIRTADVVTGVVLLPFIGLGFAVSGPLRRRVDAGRSRPAVLALCALASVVLVVRNLVGG